MESKKRNIIIVPSRIYEYYDGGCFSSSAMVDYISDIGFDGIDMSFESMDRHGEAARAVYFSVANRATSKGLKIPMCHLPFYMPDPGNSILMDKFSGQLKKGLDCAALMGIQLAVTHPIAYRAEFVTFEDYLKANIRFLYDVCEYAASRSITVCIENMASRHEKNGSHLYGINADEILCVASSIGAGTCWDTGHANISGITKQSTEMKKLGDKLLCVHLHDNNGVSDNHLIPYEGSVDWDDCIEGLSETSYSGPLEYEVKSSFLPPDREVRSHFGAKVLECGMKMADILKTVR